jgi:hypothetical protein
MVLVAKVEEAGAIVELSSTVPLAEALTRRTKSSPSAVLEA